MTMAVPANYVEANLFTQCPECESLCVFRPPSAEKPKAIQTTPSLSVFGDNLEGVCQYCNTIIYLNLRDIFQSDEEEFDEEMKEYAEELYKDVPPSERDNRIENITVNTKVANEDGGETFTSEVHVSEKLLELMQRDPGLYDAMSDHHLDVMAPFKYKGFTAFYINGVINGDVRYDENFIHVGHVVDTTDEDSSRGYKQFILYDIQLCEMLSHLDSNKTYSYGYMFKTGDTTEVSLMDTNNILKLQLVFYQEPQITLVNEEDGTEHPLSNLYGFYKQY